MTDGTGVLDEAYQRLHRTGPEFAGWLSNHAPMTVEAMVRAGRPDLVHRWVDSYSEQLDELPTASHRIGSEWLEAMGDERRIGDWIAHFRVELAERPWRAVLGTWWPRLLPGVAAGATHGVIRVGHAVRVLLEGEQTAPRLDELAHGLGYWAARWESVPGATCPEGELSPHEAIPGVPALPERSGGIQTRLARLAFLAGWPESLAALRRPENPAQAQDMLTELVDAAVLHYRTHGHGAAIMSVHGATAPNAILRTLPALPENLWVPSLCTAWIATAAVTSIYAPDRPALGASGTDLVLDEVVERAVATGDAHAIKFADTAVDTFARKGDHDALAAAQRCTDLLSPSAAG
ncbi:questin oxidase family protein [Allokutzneria sp. NRRL B-24872]|uniref:questin oxidase family protein n=1 Tax=Allokutzneria sp. NRRL B-24872 TaxID=1137961 RepID=UPI000A3C065D|nr:questin oxidase family protein [Allokutzneria sp. NRRL B-24872]